MPYNYSEGTLPVPHLNSVGFMHYGVSLVISNQFCYTTCLSY